METILQFLVEYFDIGIKSVLGMVIIYVIHRERFVSKLLTKHIEETHGSVKDIRKDMRQDAKELRETLRDQGKENRDMILKLFSGK